MTKQEYQKYQEAVEHNMSGLSFVSTGACPGCQECGLGDRWTIHIPLELISHICLELKHDSEDSALAEIEASKSDPDLIGIDLSGLKAIKRPYS